MISGVDSLVPLTHLAHPPSHNPSSNSLFSIFQSLLCFVPHPDFILFLFPFPFVHLFSVLKSSYECSHIFVFLWLISLSIIPSSSIHIVANGKILFSDCPVIFHFVCVCVCVCVCMHIYIYHVFFFFHSSVDAHLGSFHNLVIVDSTAINIGVHVPLWISIFVSLG